MDDITDQKDKITNIIIKDQIENSKNWNTFDNDNIKMEKNLLSKKILTKDMNLKMN